VNSFDPVPEVALVNSFKDPYNNVVAAARTCYSSKVVFPADVDKDDAARALRDRIYASIYEAGHHTTIQHPTFQFVLSKVSRHFIWSFLHAHPFYNSEQVSQRYVEVRKGNYTTPPLEGADRELFEAAADRMMKAYGELQELILPDIEREWFALYPARKRTAADWEKQIHKRVMEAARYVLPVATHAHLYHTISGITLHRYHRLCNQFDTPAETRIVVSKMVDEVNRLDPLFFKSIEDEIPLEKTPEAAFFTTTRSGFVEEFDRDLGPLRSKLVDWKARGQESVAQAVRSVLGLPKEAMSDADAIEAVMHPAKNPILGESLVLTTMSKLSRAMHHPHFTFRKKLSHTADSQDQRHRMAPGSRPILEAHYRPGTPDFILPPVMEKNAKVMDACRTLFTRVWKAIDELRGRGVPFEYAAYLLPNAFPIRFEESGDLLNLHHKWTTRLCYLAQEEIWRCCLEEVKQVSAVHPLLGAHLRAPCTLRKEAGRTPYCPEGDRFCGVPVWAKALEGYTREI
jgi:flavin-dependent thymidylate synthase